MFPQPKRRTLKHIWYPATVLLTLNSFASAVTETVSFEALAVARKVKKQIVRYVEYFSHAGQF